MSHLPTTHLQIPPRSELLDKWLYLRFSEQTRRALETHFTGNSLRPVVTTFFRPQDVNEEDFNKVVTDIKEELEQKGYNCEIRSIDSGHIAACIL